MRIEAMDIRKRAVAVRMLELQRLSYQVEADLLGRDDLPPMRESLETLQHSGEHFLGCLQAQDLVGAISYKCDDVLDIHRVMVHPNHFRRGVARGLLEYVQRLNPNVQRLVVQTGSLNLPAKRLYISSGFREVGQHEVVPGLWITSFEKP